jgi:hypothetical protein
MSKIKFKCEDFYTTNNDLNDGNPLYGFTFQVLEQDMNLRKERIGDVNINYHAWPYISTFPNTLFLRGDSHKNKHLDITSCLFKTKELRDENKALLLYTLKKWAE